MCQVLGLNSSLHFSVFECTNHEIIQSTGKGSNELLLLSLICNPLKLIIKGFQKQDLSFRKKKNFFLTVISTFFNMSYVDMNILI